MVSLSSLGSPRLRSSARFLWHFANRHGRNSYGTAELGLVSFSHSIIALVRHLLPRNLVTCPEKDHGLDGHGGVTPLAAPRCSWFLWETLAWPCQ
ncbi:uncharacterized protein BKA55DRAFT_559854 [Fusarium redolens]|uniref:Uncharacterized protein n=1 Tax=Fusarium redolens TaxID=48865 RepID=A0A9P9HNE7_FUSRE|nr:uncharacterized protein BKA55DRAFT_559854 [Fusarium redolens]KAH7260839.1 hypothetical protein BKA55DRAFT_559854 [Fusarium redolens]